MGDTARLRDDEVSVLDRPDARGQQGKGERSVLGESEGRRFVPLRVGDDRGSDKECQREADKQDESEQHQGQSVVPGKVPWRAAHARPARVRCSQAPAARAARRCSSSCPCWAQSISARMSSSKCGSGMLTRSTRRILSRSVGSSDSLSVMSDSCSFSPGRRPTELDVGGHAGQRDHLAGEVDDLDRLAHLEHEDVAGLADRLGLQHEPRGLGDGHEVAGDLGVGDRERSAVAQLLLEDRHDRAAAGEHVAEAHGDRVEFSSASRVEHLALGERLGQPHHVGGRDGLVGGDEHEALDAVPLARLDDLERARARWS